MRRMAMAHIQTRGWYMRAIGGMAGTRAAEGNRDTGGVISCIGRKEGVRQNNMGGCKGIGLQMSHRGG